MKVTYNWLKDFVQIRLAPEALAEKLTMAGLEVVSLKEESGDFVFEIEITSNRPDWLSVIGIAREVAAVTGGKLKLPKKPSLRAPSTGRIKNFRIDIEDKKDCPLYTAKIISGVKVAASPEWLKKRLQLLGCRSVNNIVDITNYILFEYGEPLHAFDLKKLNGEAVFIRRAKGGERITTIDGTQRELCKGILVIADQEKPVAAAGVMGGMESEVTEKTVDILLEAAVFNPVLIRKGRQSLGLQSESSYRFERGVSKQVALSASSRAAEMIMQIASGKLLFDKSCGAREQKTLSITLGLKELRDISGALILAGETRKILSGLGFGVSAKPGNKLLCKAPDFRQDAISAVDLIEEITRIHGYAKIANTLPSFSLGFKPNKRREFIRLIKETLRGLGCNEVITHSLVSGEFLESAGISASEAVRIKNPLSKEQELLRPSLLSSLLKCVGYNLNQKQEYVNIFEISNIYKGSVSSAPAEELFLGAAVCGERPLFLAKGLVKEELSSLHLKGAAESLFERLGIEKYSFRPEEGGRSAIYLGEEKCGVIFALGSGLLSALDIKNREVFYLELSLEKIFSCANVEKKFKALPRYPGITRDISFVVKEGLSVEDILSSIRQKGAPLIESVRVSDYYKGKQIPSGSRSLTVSCLYRSRERTLTEEEINPLHSAVCAELKERFQASLR